MGPSGVEVERGLGLLSRWRGMATARTGSERAWGLGGTEKCSVFFELRGFWGWGQSR